MAPRNTFELLSALVQAQLDGVEERQFCSGVRLDSSAKVAQRGRTQRWQE